MKLSTIDRINSPRRVGDRPASWRLPLAVRLAGSLVRLGWPLPLATRQRPDPTIDFCEDGASNRDRQNCSALTTSPPLRVESELKTFVLIVSFTKRTDPSQNRKLHPPGCRLQKLSTAADVLLGTTIHV
jgi:hypothetical protein